MSSEELRELHEHASHGRHEPSLAPVSLTMAILAVVVAFASLLGHRTHTEEILLGSEAADKWAQYQAKVIRRNTDQVFVDLATFVTSKNNKETLKLSTKYQEEVSRYSKEKGQLEVEAKQLEKRKQGERAKADRYDLGEVFVEISLVITSITLLSNRKIFWHVGMVLGVVGTFLIATGLLLL
jgi:hypothetical protein